MTMDGSDAVCAASTIGAPFDWSRKVRTASLPSATTCATWARSSADLARSNGTAKAPPSLATRLAEATAGASATAIRAAARAPANQLSRRARSDQRITPMATTATAMMAGTSQPGR